jgi:guanosine-3',5'-bis(diphosphate) 3'-pyrophosphohydrolase
MNQPKTNRWMQAASFAAWKHRHQIRKDGKTPYIAHPFRVAMIVRDTFGCDDAEVLAAALLHDTIEDTITDYDELHQHFGEKVALLVSALTKNMSMPEAQREDAYDRQLAAAPWEARLIKLADVFDNITDAPNPAMEAKARDKVRRAVALAENDARLALAVRLVIQQCDWCTKTEVPS